MNYLPVRPPIFIGREEELESLRKRLCQPGALVRISGLAGKGKTTLELEFAHRYQRDFEAVYWLPCQSSSLASIAAELERQLGLKLEGDLPAIVRELKVVCGGKRCLLILDNVEEEGPDELIPGGVASVLVTTRHTNLRFLRFHQPLPLPLFTDEQCFELFRLQAGTEEVARHGGECLRLFARLGRLPITVAISAALIKEDVRYTIAGLARDLPHEVTALVRQAIAALGPASPGGVGDLVACQPLLAAGGSTAFDSAPRRLLAAMAACAAEGFSLDLAADIATLEDGGALAALQQLITRSLAEEIDRSTRRYRLHALVREAAGSGRFRQAHAEAVRRRSETWEAEWRRCEQDLPDFRLALEWALENAWDPWARALAYNGFALARRVGRLAEALEVCERMRRASEERQDRPVFQAWLGHEAVILHAWGQLEEALALHKKEETICLALGNKDGLQRSYGNQALILQAWGRLEEALALLQKQEAICLELGNTAGLAYGYWQWGLLGGARGNSQGEHAKLSAALALFTELGMPRQRDAVQAELAKAQAASSS